MPMWATQDQRGLWIVMNDDTIVFAPFDTNAAAWRFIDNADKQAQSDEETRQRISKAIAQW